MIAHSFAWNCLKKVKLIIIRMSHLWLNMLDHWKVIAWKSIRNRKPMQYMFMVRKSKASICPNFVLWAYTIIDDTLTKRMERICKWCHVSIWYESAFHLPNAEILKRCIIFFCCCFRFVFVCLLKCPDFFFCFGNT